MNEFPATRESALARLEEFLLEVPRYAAQRNHVERGHENVSRLSAALSHRLIAEREVVDAVLRRHSFRSAEKFLQEVMWRGYWKGWLEWCPEVWDRYVASVKMLEDGQTAAEQEACARVAEGRSGSGMMNHFARELVETGYLHNHARMWWASYWIHHAKLPWQLGAKFFLEHLLDADAASNTLSWRWVAGLQTRGKTYLATEQNIRKFCDPGLVDGAGGVGFEENVVARSGWEDEVRDLRALSEISFPDADPQGGGNRRLAVVIHDEDLNLETGPLAGLQPKLLLQLTFKEANPLSPRGRWLAEARADGLTRARTHFGCEAKVCHGVDELASAAVGAGVEEVAVIQPFVGPMRDSVDGLGAKLEQHGLALTAWRRPWDNALLPYAQRGFFPYWNSVGRKLAKSGVEGIA